MLHNVTFHQGLYSLYSLLSGAKIKYKIMIILDFLQSKLKDIKLFQGNLTYYKRRRFEVLPRWGTLTFSYIPRHGLFLGVQNFEFQYFWGFRKINIFLSMKILWIFLGVNKKLDYFRGNFYTF